MPSKITIDQRSLIAELSASDPILKRVAEETLREAFFNPAVETMQMEFEGHPVTSEIAGGVDASNSSGTLEGSFREDESKGDAKPNLTGFIGFDKSPDEVLRPIRDRLDPSHPDGPKMVYAGRDKDRMIYRFRIDAPNEKVIYDETPIPWMEGTVSWAKRIESGFTGITHFLNISGSPASRSGAGIQVPGVLRGGRFRPVSYLSKIFNNFLRRVTGRADNGRGL